MIQRIDEIFSNSNDECLYSNSYFSARIQTSNTQSNIKYDV